LNIEAEPFVKMATTKVTLELLKLSLVFPRKVAVRSFHCTPICERLIRTFREKPRPDNRPVKYVPYQGKTEVKPRDDVYFLRSQDPPSHTFKEALDVLRAYAFYEETVRVNLRLDMKEKKIRTEAIRGTVLVARPFKPKKILVFAEGDLALQAKESDADFIGGKELIPQVEAGELEFDYCLSSLDFLPNLSHMPKILKDKMPNTRRGTATDDIGSAVTQYRKGHSYKTTRMGHINSEIGLLSFTNSEIRENMRALFTAIESHKPESVKRENFYKQLVLSSQYGPGLVLNYEEFNL